MPKRVYEVKQMDGSLATLSRKDIDHVINVNLNGNSLKQTPEQILELQVDGKPNEEIKARGQWTSGIEFLLSCISMSVGLGNVWRFPYTAYKYGGGAFLIPYLILLFLIGRPIYYMEMILGQFSGRGPIKVWKCVPAFKGIGFAQVITTCYITIFYNYLMALTFYYLFSSFQSQLPWTVCDPEWCDSNTTFPIDQTTTSTPASSDVLISIDAQNAPDLHSKSPVNTSISELYWLHHVLKQSSGLDEVTWVNWKLALCLAGSWVLVYFSIIKGVSSLGKVAYFTALFPYAVLITLLIFSMTEPGAFEGIRYFFAPDWKILLNPIVWYKAVEQSFFSLAVCFGAIIMYSSYNGFRNNVYRDAIIISVLDTFTSILAGCVIFAVLGTMSHKSGVDIKDIVRGDLGLAFVVYPEALSKIDWLPQLWSVLFFIMLYTLGIGSSVAQVETILTCIRDEFTQFRTKKWLLALIACIFLCLCGIPLTTDAGTYILKLLDNYGVGTAVFFYGILQTIGIMWIYGLGQFCDDVKFMIKQSVGKFWKITWAFTAPIVLIIIFVYGNIELITKSEPSPGIPSWGNGIGWALAALAVFQIPLWMFITIYKQNGMTIIEKIRKAFSPAPDWGPSDPELFKAWIAYKKAKKPDIEPKFYFNSAFAGEEDNKAKT